MFIISKFLQTVLKQTRFLSIISHTTCLTLLIFKYCFDHKSISVGGSLRTSEYREDIFLVLKNYSCTRQTINSRNSSTVCYKNLCTPGINSLNWTMNIFHHYINNVFWLRICGITKDLNDNTEMHIKMYKYTDYIYETKNIKIQIVNLWRIFNF